MEEVGGFVGVYAGGEDGLIFVEEAAEFAIEHRFYIAAFNHLTPFPGTPLYNRLKAEGRMLPLDPTGGERAHYVGTAGGTNFHPLLMTREELYAGQMGLYKRLYEPEAFAARLMGNLSRFHNVTFRPEPPNLRGLGVLWRLVKHYWTRSSKARR